MRFARVAMLLAVAMLMLMPMPAYAHTVGGPGGVEIELVLVALAAILAGFAMRRSASVKTWVPWAVMGIGVIVAGAAFAVPRVGSGPAQSDTAVSIVRPEPGELIPAGEPVSVEVELINGTVASSATDESGGHLHLFVDGELQNMQYSTEASIELSPGSHEIRVEYVDFRHVSFDPRIEDTIHVTAS